MKSDSVEFPGAPSPPNGMDKGSASWREWWSRSQADTRVPAIAAVHLAALANLAVAQPIYNLIALEPMVLAVHRARPWEIVFLAVCLSLLLPLTLTLLLYVMQRWAPRAVGPIFLLLVFLSGLAMAMPAWKRLILLPGAWLSGLALVTALVSTWGYARSRAIRLLVTYAAAGVLFFPALFLFRPPISNLVFLDQRAGAVGAEARNPVPIVMVLFDEFSVSTLLNAQRQIDAEKFPNFARLAQDATWYRNATSMSGYTQYAVPALLTGCRPRDLPATVANFPDNLFTALARQYKLTVFEPYTTLCPVEVDPAATRHTPAVRMWRLGKDLGRIYGQFLLPFDLAPSTFSRYSQEYDKYVFARQRVKTQGLVRYNWSQSRAEQFEHFLETIRPTEQPVLYFGHIVLPHIGYDYLPSGRRHSSRVDAPANYWSKDVWHMAQQRQHNLLQVIFVDRLLGKLIDKLKASGLYDRCLLVVVADHGVTFRPGNHGRDVTPETAPDLMWIPMFVKTPHQAEGAASDRNMELIDVLPTMFEVLDVRGAWPFDGISALDPERPQRPQKTFYRMPQQTMEFSADFPEKNSTLSAHLQWFASPGGVESLFRFGPHKELVGKSLSQFEISAPARVRLTIEDRDSFQGVQQDAHPWPCFFWGEVDQAVHQEPVPLAVAVNGRIEAVTRTFVTSQQEVHWQALVPEESIRLGDNKVEVFVIRTRGKKTYLEATMDAGP